MQINMNLFLTASPHAASTPNINSVRSADSRVSLISTDSVNFLPERSSDKGVSLDKVSILFSFYPSLLLGIVVWDLHFFQTPERKSGYVNLCPSHPTCCWTDRLRSLCGDTRRMSRASDWTLRSPCRPHAPPSASAWISPCSLSPLPRPPTFHPKYRLFSVLHTCKECPVWEWWCVSETWPDSESFPTSISWHVWRCFSSLCALLFLLSLLTKADQLKMVCQLCISGVLKLISWHTSKVWSGLLVKLNLALRFLTLQSMKALHPLEKSQQLSHVFHEVISSKRPGPD